MNPSPLGTISLTSTAVFDSPTKRPPRSPLGSRRPCVPIQEWEIDAASARRTEGICRTHIPACARTCDRGISHSPRLAAHQTRSAHQALVLASKTLSRRYSLRLLHDRVYGALLRPVRASGLLHNTDNVSDLFLSAAVSLATVREQWCGVSHTDRSTAEALLARLVPDIFLIRLLGELVIIGGRFQAGFAELGSVSFLGQSPQIGGPVPEIIFGLVHVAPRHFLGCRFATPQAPLGCRPGGTVACELRPSGRTKPGPRARDSPAFRNGRIRQSETG